MEEMIENVIHRGASLDSLSDSPHHFFLWPETGLEKTIVHVRWRAAGSSADRMPETNVDNEGNAKKRDEKKNGRMKEKWEAEQIRFTRV